MDHFWNDEELEQPAPLPPLAEGAEVAVRLRGLCKSFGKRTILRGIDLDIVRGETLVVLGVSGSGKTTFLKHLMGTHRADSGELLSLGQNLRQLDRAGWNAYRRRLGVVFQMAALLGSLTVEENVGLPLIEVERKTPDAVRPEVISALRRVFLPGEQILHLRPDELSGGMRKRVGIARAIVRQPDLMLYDEPTTGLDPVTVTGVGELIRSLQQQLGLTSVVITHDLGLADQIADRIALLYNGRLVALGTREEIRNHPHPVLKQLLSGSTQGPLTRDYITAE